MDLSELGKRCAASRRALGLTQVQLADLAGVSYRPIYQIEDGRSIRLDTLIKICDALGMDICLKDRGGMKLDRS